MRAVVIIVLGSMFMSGCFRGMPSDKPPVHVNPSMLDQPRYNPQARSKFFADGSAMRVPPAGTVARGFLREDDAYFTGKIDTTPIGKSPVPITPELLRRGQERFAIFCSPCHSRLGDGKGIVVNRGYLPPPSFHDDRIRKFPDGHIFDVVTNGIRNMPAYRYQIPVEDRWAIVAYVRALQRSQNARREDIPPEIQKTLK